MTRASLRVVLAASALAASFATADARADARAAEGPNRFSTTLSAGWMHASVVGVPIDTAALSLGIGFTHQRPRGFGVDIHGTLGGRLGRTKAGRTVRGLEPFGIAVVLHYHWFRIGVGMSSGTLDVERSTNGESQGALIGGVYANAGVEPFSVAGRPLFVEAQLHHMAWGDHAMNALLLAIGVRFCGEGCAP